MRFSETTLLAACAAASLALPFPAAAELRVVATLPVFAEMAEAIGGDRVRVDTVAKPLQDPHFIQPTPWAIARVSRASVFVTAGLDLELWRGPLLEAAANSRLFMGNPGYVDLSVGIDLLQIPAGGVSRQAGDIHVMGNPHYFYAPDGMIQASRTLEDRLLAIDPAGAAGYQARAGEYRSRLAAASRRWLAKLAPYRGTKVVPFHNSFPYLERWSGLEILDHVEPKPGINPSAAHLARLTLRMRQEGVKLILHEPWYNKRFSDALARRTDAEVVMFYSQPGPGTTGEDFVSMMDGNVDEIVRVLSGGAGPD